MKFTNSWLISTTIWLITACGGTSGGGTGDTAGLPPELPASCKNLYSVWTSTTDQEQWDFTSLYNGATNNDYSFIAYDGAACGYANNPNHEMTAKIEVWSSPVSPEFHYTLNMHASLALAGQCAYYTAPSSSGGKYITIMVKMRCNEIELCQNFGAGTCKTFR